MWPQLTFIVISVAGATLTLAKSDKDWTDRAGTFIALFITHGLLCAGGFYNVFLH